MILFHVVYTVLLVLFSTMDTTTGIKPKTMAELLPELSSILSKDSIQSLTAKKQPRQAIPQSRTSEKVLKPLTIAEMRADILALKVRSPRSFAQGVASVNKRNWNSSVKVDSKLVSHTSNGELKNNPVRKVLNFQPKSKTLSRATIAPEAPKFQRPENLRVKKSLHHLHARNNVRISGVAAIAETPVVNIPHRNRLTLANKENTSNQSNVKRHVPPRFPSQKIIKPPEPVVDTPISNASWKSSGDASFLLNEKEINDEEEQRALPKEQILKNVVEVTPPASTPFKDYRSVHEYFGPSTVFDNSDIVMYNDDTIMTFEDTNPKPDIKDTTAVVSLTELLGNVSLKVSKKASEPENLSKLEAEAINNIRVIDETIASLQKLKESQKLSLLSLKQLIETRQSNAELYTTKKDFTETTKFMVLNMTETPEYALKQQPKSTVKAHQSVESVKNLLPKKIESPESIESKILDSSKDADTPNVLDRAKDLKVANANEAANASAPEFLEITPKPFETTETNKIVKYSVEAQLSKTTTTKSDLKSPTYKESKSPSYKIPNRKMCLRKRILSKSVPKLSNNETPVKQQMGTQAMSMYMKMKKHMNFLNTPVLKRPEMQPDTPAVTSFNLQKQLDELYDES